MKLNDHEIQQLIKNIQTSRKYPELGLNPETVRDLITQEAPSHSSPKSLRKAVRRKLHNIVAPYLGEPDYQILTNELESIESTDPHSKEMKAFCLRVLSEHASTAERIPIMADFYQQIFAVTGLPEIILDLACGLHPLAFSWMELTASTNYHAFDIIQPRVDFINAFFVSIGMEPLAQKI